MILRESKAGIVVNQVSLPSPQELQTRFLDEVLSYVSTFIRPVADAEDVTMEVFHAAFQHLHKLRNKDDPRIWLLGIARRKVADTLRRRYRRKESPLSEAHDCPAPNASTSETSAMIQQILSELPLEQREALVLKYVNGLATKEIGNIFGRSEIAINSLLQRARESFYVKGAPMFEADREVNHV